MLIVLDFLKNSKTQSKFHFSDAFQTLSYTPINQKRSSILRSQSRKMLKPPRDDRLSWPALLRADNKGPFINYAT